MGPIILYEPGYHVIAFRNEEEAIASQEPQDYGEYIVYDRTGNTYAITIVNNTAKLVPCNTAGDNERVLERILVWYLSQLHKPKIFVDWIIHASLDELIEKMIEVTHKE